jgi:hypothetical protein
LTAKLTAKVFIRPLFPPFRLDPLARAHPKRALCRIRALLREFATLRRIYGCLSPGAIL